MNKLALFFRLCVVATCFGVVFAVFFSWSAEFSVTQVQKRPAMDWYLTETVEDIRPAGSVEAQYSAVFGCERAINAPVARLMLANSRQQVASKCLAAMDLLLERAPSFSGAHLIRAQALSVLGQDDLVREALVTSERWGRGVQWMAAARLELMLRMAQGGTVAGSFTDDMMLRDVARLLSNGRDAEILAELHATYPQARESLLARIEMLPPEAQRLFLNAVRRS